MLNVPFFPQQKKHYTNHCQVLGYLFFFKSLSCLVRRFCERNRSTPRLYLSLSRILRDRMDVAGEVI